MMTSLMSAIEIVRWLFGLQRPGSEATLGEIFLTVIALPTGLVLIAIPFCWWASRHAVTVDENHIIVSFDGDEVERRVTMNFKSFERNFPDTRWRMRFEVEPALYIPRMSDLQANALHRYLQEITQ